MFFLLYSVSLATAAQIKVKPEDAAKHVGDSVAFAVRFTAACTWNMGTGQPTLINVCAAYPNAPFTVVIFRQPRALFTTAPEVYYKA